MLVGRSVGLTYERSCGGGFSGLFCARPSLSEDSVAAGAAAAAAFSLAVVSTNANVRIGGSKQGFVHSGHP